MSSSRLDSSTSPLLTHCSTSCIGLIFVLLSQSGTDTLPSTVYDAVTLLLSQLYINTAASVAITH